MTDMALTDTVIDSVSFQLCHIRAADISEVIRAAAPLFITAGRQQAARELEQSERIPEFHRSMVVRIARGDR